MQRLKERGYPDDPRWQLPRMVRAWLAVVDGCRGPCAYNDSSHWFHAAGKVVRASKGEPLPADVKIEELAAPVRVPPVSC